MVMPGGYMTLLQELLLVRSAPTCNTHRPASHLPLEMKSFIAKVCIGEVKE